MGMCLGLAALSDANIARVLANPPLIWRVVSPDDPEAYELERAEQSKPSLLSRLLRRTRQAGEQVGLTLSTAEAATTADLDKAWHGIHYLLTGNAGGGRDPLNFLVSGGATVGTIEVGYGPARVLTAVQTKQVRDALAALSDADLAARFDPADMTAKDIYPAIIWSRPPQQESLDYAMEYLAVLRRFLDGTVGKGLGAVIYVS